MSNYIYTRNDRLYIAKSTALGAINVNAGAATIAATDACKHISFSARSVRSRIAAADKEAAAFAGYIDRTRAGRLSGSASVRLPLMSGSAPGVAPDYGPILESAFGKVAVVADTSVTYSAAGAKYLDESTPVLCELWGFNNAVRGVVAYSALVNRLTLTAGQDGAELAADLLAHYVLAQDRYANASAAEKGGMSVGWPTEPASQTYTGSPVNGFTLLATLDGTAYNPRNLTITMDMKRAFRMDRCAIDGSEFFGSEPFEGTGENGPSFTLDIDLWSTDAAAQSALLAKIANRTPFNASVQIGATAGGIYTWPLKNLIRPDGDDDPQHEDGDDRKVIRLSGLRAQCTNTSARDESNLVLT